MLQTSQHFCLQPCTLQPRYFEFFDHYLKGAPAPKWMKEGVPFLKKDAKPVNTTTPNPTTTPSSR